jgi:hypothetical protein
VSCAVALDELPQAASTTSSAAADALWTARIIVGFGTASRIGETR